MGSVTQPRGRLPRRVYWVRRALVVALAGLLVFGIGRLVGGLGSDDPQGPVRARTAGSTSATQSSTTAAVVTMGPVAPPSQVVGKKSATPVLAAPTGDCVADDVSVLPSVPEARGGRDITVNLQLLGTQPACTFTVSPESLVVKITSGQDRIWSSQDCPRAVPERTVIVRSAVPVTVPLTWNAKRSDDECSNHTAWARPGFYHVFAAALGSTPADVQFEVTLPGRPVVTKTITPKPQPEHEPQPKPQTQSKSHPATATPTS